MSRQIQAIPTPVIWLARRRPAPVAVITESVAVSADLTSAEGFSVIFYSLNLPIDAVAVGTPLLVVANGATLPWITQIGLDEFTILAGVPVANWSYVWVLNSATDAVVSQTTTPDANYSDGYVYHVVHDGIIQRVAAPVAGWLYAWVLQSESEAVFQLTGTPVISNGTIYVFQSTSEAVFQLAAAPVAATNSALVSITCGFDYWLYGVPVVPPRKINDFTCWLSGVPVS